MIDDRRPNIVLFTEDLLFNNNIIDATGTFDNKSIPLSQA